MLAPFLRKMFLVLTISLCANTFAQSVGISFSLGLTWTAPTDITVIQKGQPDTVVEGARFVGKDLEYYPYYSVRTWVGNPDGLRLELELTHQKVIFESAEKNGEIFDYYRATDGLNYAFLNVSHAFGDELRVVPRIGVALMVPHPETRVRGKEYGIDGDASFYEINGFGFQAGATVEYKYWMSPVLEARYTFARTGFTIADGFAQQDFNTLHFNFGGQLVK